MNCPKPLYRSRWRSGSTIPFEIVVDRVDQTDLSTAGLIFRVVNEDRSIAIAKSTQAGTILFVAQTAQSLKAVGQIGPTEITVYERTRLYFAIELILPNGDELPITEPGQDYFDLYPEVGI
jgi:hypothetical protein